MIPGFFEGTEMPAEGWWKILWPDPAAVLMTVGLKPGMRAIDLCCGDGWFTLPMARLASEVVAIDIDPKMIAAARERLAVHQITNCRFIVADAGELDRLVSEPADLVLMANAFHGVPDRSGLARAVKSVLRPGGFCVIVNWHQRPREETMVLDEPRGPKTELRLSPDETAAAVQAGGLSPAALLELPPYHYAALFQAV